MNLKTTNKMCTLINNKTEDVIETTNEVDDFDYSFGIESEMTAEQIAERDELYRKLDQDEEQARYARMMELYSMDVKDHTTLKECKRCNGKGTIQHYGHVQNGICFSCGGYGKK